MMRTSISGKFFYKPTQELSTSKVFHSQDPITSVQKEKLGMLSEKIYLRRQDRFRVTLIELFWAGGIPRARVHKVQQVNLFSEKR